MLRTTLSRVVSVLVAVALPVVWATPPDPAFATTPSPPAPTAPAVKAQTLRPAAEQDGSWGDHWGFQLSGGAAATFSDDTTTAHSGRAALKITNASSVAPNVFASVWQPVATTPGTTYVFSAWVKADSTSHTQFTVTSDWAERYDAPDGSYDWRRITFEHTAAPWETSLAFRVIVQDTTTAFWLDDVSMTAKGEEENLLTNTGFEPGTGDQELLARFDALRANVTSLRRLLDRARAQRIAVDYEAVKVETIASLLPYGRDDVTQGQAIRARYVLGEMERLRDEARASVNAYLTHQATPLVSPRYDTDGQGVKVRGRQLVATTRTATRQVEHDRPVLLNGYGHFDQVERDIPRFRDLGVNAAQIEIGPDNTVFPADLPGYQPARTGNADVTFARDTTTAHTGDAALKVTSGVPGDSGAAATLTQTVVVEPNARYDVSLWVKGEDVSALSVSAGIPSPTTVDLPTGSYDWTRVTFSFQVGPDTDRLGVTFRADGPAGAAWIDDLTVKPALPAAGNVATNPGFEDHAAPGADFSVDTTVVAGRIVGTLHKAAAGDVAVNLLLSPHYLPAWAYEKWPDLRIPNGGFLAFDVNNPHARDIVAAHIHAVMSLVGDLPALQSVVLSNEPVYPDSSTSAHTSRLWHDWLAAHYSSVGEMNTAWATSYASFNAVPTTNSAVRATPYFYDWTVFNDTMFADWHAWMADQVHAVAPDVAVQAKIMAFQVWDQGTVGWGVDINRFSDLGQISGDDNYGFLDSGTDGYARAEATNEMQASAAAKPVFNSEDHLIPDGSLDYGPQQALNARQILWNGAIHGRNGSTIWLWSQAFNGMLGRPDVVAEVGRASLDLNRLAHEVSAFQNARPKVAILTSRASQVYTSGNQNMNQTLNSYKAFTYDGQDSAFVSEAQAGKDGLTGYRAVVLPRTTHVSADTLAALKTYVAGGGRIIAVGDDVLTADEHDRPLDATDRATVLTGAATFPADAAFTTLRDGFMAELDRLGVAEVVLVDTDTGKPVNSVDYQTVRDEDGLLVAVTNYARQTTKHLALEVEGQRIQTPVTDLIAAERVGGTRPITLTPLGSLLLRVPA